MDCARAPRIGGPECMMYNEGAVMRPRLRRVTIACAVGALILVGAFPALANGLCGIVGTGVLSSVVVSPGVTIGTSMPAVQTTGRFVPTILDALAFPTFPLAPVTLPVRVVPQIVVCPSVVVVSPAVVSPIFLSPVILGSPFIIDPPAPGSVPASSSPPARSPASSEPPAPGIFAISPSDTVGDLARAPGRFDRQVVSVTGTVTGYQERFDDRGAFYASFRLEEGGASIPVIARERQALRAGLRVLVTGTFYDVAPFGLAGGDRPRHVLEALLIRPAGGTSGAR